MFPRTVETAFARFRAKGEAKALAIVFDRTAPELLRLARHLAPDASQAEDLVQATFLTAIESAQQFTPGLPVLPWLCGILANHARAGRRRERRAPDPLRLKRDDVADVHAEVHERELREEVLDAIGRLPEAYRPVLRLWLEHGLEAHEIAATLERPSGTVRAQISRGLEQLRRALPPSLAGAAAVVTGTGRGLAAVRADVLAACSGTATGFASALAIGGLMMMHHKLLVGGGAAAFALLAWLAWPPPAGAVPSASGTDAGVPAVATAEGSRGVPTDPSRASVPASESQREPVTPNAPEAPAPDERTALVVRLVDADDGHALAGYGVSIRAAAQLQAFGDLPTYRPTGADGRVRFADLEPTSWVIDVDRVGRVRAVTVAPDTTTEAVVELPRTGVITGEVVDPRGQPVPGASVLAPNNDLRPPQLLLADAAGRFRIEHADRLMLQARHAAHAPSLAHEVATPPGGQVHVRLQLGEAGRRVAGTVRDRDGGALAGCPVAVLPAAAREIRPWDHGKPRPFALWLTADDDGRFATGEVGAEELLVVACPLDRSLPPVSGVADTTHTDGFVDLRCQAPTIIEGRILENGEPAAGVQVLVFPEQPAESIGYLVNIVGLRMVPVAADGTFHVTGVLPGTVSLRATRAMQTLAEERFELAPGGRFEWQPAIGALSSLRVTVRAPAPLPPRMMALVFVPRNGGAPTMLPIPPNGSVDVAVQRSDPIDVLLAVTPGGASIVQLARRSGVPANEAEVVFDLGANELPNGSLRGRLIDELGAPLSATSLHVNRVDDRELVVLVQGMTDANGAFAIGPLPAGEYQLSTGTLSEPSPLQGATLLGAGDEHLGDIVVKRH